MNELNYTISMLGPTSVGKTSLIATIFEMARIELLVGKPFDIQPNNMATEKKLAAHARELRSSINAKNFNSGAVAGTQSSFTFSFDLKSASNDTKVLNFNILDFPGGWIDVLNRPDDKNHEWEQCKETIIQSAVLVIPVEATVIMEAKTKEQLRAIEYNLQIETIKDVVTMWSKNRNTNFPNQPSVVIFVPVKCESYFTDNVNTKQPDKSVELFNQTQRYYGEVIDTIHKEFTKANVSILYSPVDTIGSVELIGGKWKEEEDTLRFSGKYHITQSTLHPKGGEDIFITLCKNLVNTQAMIEKENLEKIDRQKTITSQAVANANEYAERDEGIWGNLKLWWTDEREKRRKLASEKSNELKNIEDQHEQQQQKYENVATLIQDISTLDFSHRTKAIK